MKPGGNYTQPVYDPISEQTCYEVYVGWTMIARVDNDAEATFALRSALLAEAAITELDTVPAL